MIRVFYFNRFQEYFLQLKMADSVGQIRIFSDEEDVDGVLANK